MRRTVAGLVFTFAIYGQVTPQFPGSLVTDRQLPPAVNLCQSTLALAMTDTVSLTATVASGTCFPVNGIVTIEGIVSGAVTNGEKLQIASKSGNVLTFYARGAFGTTAATHAIGTLVEARREDYQLNSVYAEVMSMQSGMGANFANLLRNFSCIAATSSGTTYACSSTVSPGAYTNGTIYRFKADVDNTGAPTINLNGLGAKTIKKPQGAVTTDLVAGDIRAGQWVLMMYDGTNMQMQSQLGNAPSGSGNLADPGANGPINRTGLNTTAPSTAHNLSGPHLCAPSTASGTTYACTTSPTFTPGVGDLLIFRPDVANTGAPTLNVNSSSAAPIKKQAGAAALVANDILASPAQYLFVYDGMNWEMVSQTGNAITGSGASQTAQLLDWPITRTSGTVLTFGATCTPTTPCNVNIGGTIYPKTDGPYTIAQTGSHTGRICTYIANNGALSVAVGGASLVTGDITVSTGLTAVSQSGGNCPSDSLQLHQWDDTSGSWNSGTGTFLASAYSYKPSPIAGHGVTITPGVRDTIAVSTTNGACVGSPGNTSGTYGDFCTDSTPVVYVCKNVSGCTVSADWASVGSGGSGGLAAPVVFSANASPQTYTVPAGINRVRVQLWGPGGGGQGTQTGNAAGVGGAGGAYVDTWCSVSPGASITVTVPLGAAGGAAGSAAPDAGDTSFGTCATALGGKWSGDHSLPGYWSQLGNKNIWYKSTRPTDVSVFSTLPYARLVSTNIFPGDNYMADRLDGGSPGGRAGDPGTAAAGAAGSSSDWAGAGGGSGAMDYGGAVHAGGTGGASAFGGAGGNGGGTNSGSLTACTAGATPGGGGGAAPQDTTHTASGCAGGGGKAVVWQ